MSCNASVQNAVLNVIKCQKAFGMYFKKPINNGIKFEVKRLLIKVRGRALSPFWPSDQEFNEVFVSVCNY